MRLVVLCLFAVGFALYINAYAGGACVMAKWRGQTLDYALTIKPGHAVEAQEVAVQQLRDKGFADFAKHVDVLAPQAISALEAGYVVVIKTQYDFQPGKERVSYGCGFDANSPKAALWAAMENLQSFSWGWKPDRDGFEVIEAKRF